MEADYGTALARASELLEKHMIVKPPVDVRLIAEREGFDVFFADFGDLSEEVSGVFDFKSGEIIVNSNIPANRKAFTIAHELGHALLHEKHAKSKDYRAMPYRHSRQGMSAEELEADAFAASLLVPPDFLKAYATNSSFTELAMMFAVSPDVIMAQWDSI